MRVQFSPVFMAILFVSLHAAQLPQAQADTCGSGSSAACKHYCRFPGPVGDASRKACSALGCKVTGVAPCPRPEKKDRFKVCVAPSTKGLYPFAVLESLRLSLTTVASSALP